MAAESGGANRARRRRGADAETAVPVGNGDPSEDVMPSPPLAERSGYRRDRDTLSLRAAREAALDLRPSLFAQVWASMRGLLGLSSDQYFLSRYQVAASTPLQMTLYFSVPFAVVWAASNQLLFYWKARVFDVPVAIAVISPMMFWVWFLLEPVRLLLGYVGNLNERVAWLGGFWVLTIFPQLIVHVFFLLGQPFLWFNMPVETWSSVVYVVMSVGQLLIGYSTMKRLVAKAMADFHLHPINPAENAVVGRL